jgi:hypothetical protein
MALRPQQRSGCIRSLRIEPGVDRHQQTFNIVSSPTPPFRSQRLRIREAARFSSLSLPLPSRSLRHRRLQAARWLLYSLTLRALGRLMVPPAPLGAAREAKQIVEPMMAGQSRAAACRRSRRPPRRTALRYRGTHRQKSGTSDARGRLGALCAGMDRRVHPRHEPAGSEAPDGFDSDSEPSRWRQHRLSILGEPGKPKWSTIASLRHMV